MLRLAVRRGQPFSITITLPGWPARPARVTQAPAIQAPDIPVTAGAGAPGRTALLVAWMRAGQLGGDALTGDSRATGSRC